MMDATWEDIGRTRFLNVLFSFCELEHAGCKLEKADTWSHAFGIHLILKVLYPVRHVRSGKNATWKREGFTP